MLVTSCKSKKMMRLLCCAFFASCTGFSPGLSAQQNAEPSTSKASLIAALQNWAAPEIGVNPPAIEVLADDPRLIIKPCESEYRFSFPFSNQNTVSASCEFPAWRLNLRIRIVERSLGFVFVEDFPAGTVIDKNDIEETLVEHDAYENLEQGNIVGRALSTAVQAGQRVRGSLLAETITQYKVLVDIEEGSIIDSSMIDEVETRLRNIAMGNRLLRADIQGTRAARNIPRGTVLSRSDVLIPQAALFTTALIARGSLLSSEMLQERIHFGDLPRDTVSSLDALGRATAIRQLSPGKPVRYSDVRPLAAVSKGEIVELTVRRGAITVTIDMEAIEQGFIGDQIQLRNIESGRLVTAIVTGPGTVKRD